jgi:hypothetical protein
MLDFDDHDLVEFAQRAGFEKIHLELIVDIFPGSRFTTWDTFLKTAPNHLVPTLEETLNRRRQRSHCGVPGRTSSA